LSTKVHLVADQRCRPVAFVTTVGQRHDAVAFELVLGKVAVARLGAGRPRTRPDYALADKAYSSTAIREHLARRGIQGGDPDQGRPGRRSRPQGQPGRSATGVRPGPLPAPQHRRTVGHKLRATRAVATRYDKRDYVYRGTLTVSAIQIWLRDPVSTQLQDTP